MLDNQICSRCKKATGITTMSMFNEEMICISCKEKEQDHPDYEKARTAERNEIKQGNWNFKGIGKPIDL